MSGIAAPAVRIFQVLDEFRNARSAHIWFQVSFLRRLFRNDTINPPQRVAAPEIQGFLDRLRNGFRRLNDFAVDIGDVQISVRPVREITRSEPGIGGSQKFALLFFWSAAGGEGDALRS